MPCGLFQLKLFSESTLESPCESGNEPFDSVKYWEILEWLNNWWLLQKGSVQ
jgi:hypothetical protein